MTFDEGKNGRATRIAFFVTAHGFGHAARASAIMAALRRVRPRIGLDVFTTVPRRFFEESVPGGVDHHPVETDVGLVQRSALRADTDATVQRLDRWLPFERALVTSLAETLSGSCAKLVVCDIAPLGIAVAEEVGLESFLVENFTWDWIYAPLVASSPGIQRHIDYLRGAFARATVRIQAGPPCTACPGTLETAPIWRAPKHAPAAVRARLGIPPAKPMVLLSMGGIPGDYPFTERLRDVGGETAALAPVFVIPGAAERATRVGSALLLPQHSDYYHPDLVAAADAVVGKLGYSTVAEVYGAGAPFGYVSREDSRESPVLARFVSERLPSIAIDEDEFTRGDWLARLPGLLDLPRLDPPTRNGADEAASAILQRLEP